MLFCKHLRKNKHGYHYPEGS
ncbi:MAG: hypothetical protein RI894_2218, partial [Bacteroidota bacterium]